MCKSPEMTGMRDRENRPPRRILPRSFKVLVMTAVLTATMSLTLSGVASAAGTGTLARAATYSAGTCEGPSIKVQGTGIPILDQRGIQQAITLGESTGQCVLLLGHFNLGFCVLCISITGPVTVTGEADPTGPSPNPASQTVVRATGGLGSLQVNEPPDAPPGLVRVSNIWWRGMKLVALTLRNFYRGTILIDHNRITNISPRLHFRVGIAGTPLIIPGSHVLTGNLIVRDNYVNTTATPFPVQGDDNGIALQGTTFNTVDWSHNTVITKGESLELEGTVGQSVNIDDNTVVTDFRANSVVSRVVNTVGYPKLHGGHPAALKFAGNDVANFSITNNDITVEGGSNTSVCIMQYMGNPSTSVHPQRTTQISGNRCTMQGIFAGLLGGWAGELPFFPQGTLDNAVVTDNTFSGTADFGLTMMDFTVPLAPENNLANTSHGDLFAGNDLSAFTPINGGASLYFGPSTHDNTFTGNPHGPVVNLGTNNHIVITG
jgi:hypothetical protein